MTKINKEKQAVMPQKLLHELFDYNSVTGDWKWIKTGKGRNASKTAGCLDKSTGYIRVCVNGRNYYTHRLAWAYVYGDYPEGEQPFIDHLNGKRNDNRIENLKVSSCGENNKNVTMNPRNTSGINGVSRVGIHNRSEKNPKINYYWKASWYDESGKRRFKLFPLLIYGEEEARQMSINHRTTQLRLLEVSFGIKYSERHGREDNLQKLILEQIDLNAGVK